MKKRIFSSFLILIFLFCNTTFVYAKGSTGGRSVSSSKSSSSSSKSTSSSSSSKSSGSSSSSSRSVTGSGSSSSGYSGSSTSKGTTNSGSTSSGSTSSGSTSSGTGSSNSSGSSSSGYSGSSSSKGTTSGSTSTSKTTAKTESAKTQYMQETYKKQVSSTSYNNYKSKLNDEQKKTYESSMNGNYWSGNKMDFDQSMRTRTSRMSSYETRPIRVNINTYNFGGPFSYGSAFAGPWDLWFLMRASDLFWYHHWSEISPYRNHFEAAQFSDMEKRIKQLEAQNMARNSSYMEPGVDPDLMFSGDYQQQNMDKLYYTNKYAKPVTSPIRVFVPILIISIGLIIIIFALSKRKVQKPARRNGGIY